jgi:hypothetical protein
MQIGEINAAALRHSGTTGERAEPDCPAPTSEGRALIPLAPVPELSERQSGYRNASFLAHLIATKYQHPQTRERRRAEPDEVLAAYRATVALSAF